MVKITFLGACQEVGRSAVLIESEESGDSILLDYGTKMGSNEQLFPAHVSGKSITAIVLTHAHIDHSGGVPLFYISGSVPLYCTELTYKISELLLQDMINISEVFLPFEKAEINKMRHYAQFIKYKERKRVGKNTWITLINAGHIPGSACVVIEMDHKTILYTGDINTNPTRLLDPLIPSEFPELDIIITETTYGTTNHLPRMQIEDDFLRQIKEIVENKGVVVIPAFGVGRSQEMLMVVYREGDLPFPVIVDGMARKVAYIYEKYPEMLHDPKTLSEVIKKAHFVTKRENNTSRNNFVLNPGVIIAPSGMLRGGTSRLYVDKIMHDPNSAIFLVSYQIEDTPGRILMDKGQWVDDTLENGQPVKSKYKQFDFSSHCGEVQLIDLLKQIHFKDPSKKLVYCVHGDKDTMIGFAEKVRQLGFFVETPLESQSFII